MNKNDIRYITEASVPRLTVDTPLTYEQLAKQHGMTVYEVRRALGLLQ